jgi:hypothetical protein
LDPSQARFSIFFSPIQKFILGSDRSKKTNQGLRSLMGMPRQKSKMKPKSTDKPNHVIFDIGSNGDIEVPIQNLAKAAQTNGRNNDEDVAMALEAEEPETAGSRQAAQALDILGDISLFVPWIERRLSRPAS